MTGLRPKCPTGCGRPVPVGKLMCLPCWREVPPHLQREVYRAWRAWSRDMGNVAKMHAYGEIRDQAIGAIR